MHIQTTEFNNESNIIESSYFINYTGIIDQGIIINSIINIEKEISLLKYSKQQKRRVLPIAIEAMCLIREISPLPAKIIFGQYEQYFKVLVSAMIPEKKHAIKIAKALNYLNRYQLTAKELKKIYLKKITSFSCEDLNSPINRLGIIKMRRINNRNWNFKLNEKESSIEFSLVISLSLDRNTANDDNLANPIENKLECTEIDNLLLTEELNIAKEEINYWKVKYNVG